MISAPKHPSEGMVSIADELELRHCACGMEDFEAVCRHLIAWVVKAEVDVLQEQWQSLQPSEELARSRIFADFLPELGLLTVSTLSEVLIRIKVHVEWPNAPIDIRFSTVLGVLLMK